MKAVFSLARSLGQKIGLVSRKGVGRPARAISLVTSSTGAGTEGDGDSSFRASQAGRTQEHRLRARLDLLPSPSSSTQLRFRLRIEVGNGNPVSNDTTGGVSNKWHNCRISVQCVYVLA